MIRAALALLLLSLTSHTASRAATPYAPALKGHVAGYRLSGVEPDGDPLYQILLDTTLSPSGAMPRLHLVVNAYMENFKPDTTPILPDLLHPQQTAQNLGGFLEGKAVITDDSGSILYTGIFTAEAFLDNTNHVVMNFSGLHAARGAAGSLRGSFTLHKDASLDGPLAGHLVLPAPARTQIARHRGGHMPSLQTIIAGITVKPHPMVGRSTSGSSGAPLHTGYGAAPAAATRRPVPTLAIVAGAGAVLSFLLAGLIWWWQRRTEPVGA